LRELSYWGFFECAAYISVSSAKGKDTRFSLTVKAAGHSTMIEQQKRRQGLKVKTHLQMALHFIIGKPIYLHELPDLFRCSHCSPKEHRSGKPSSKRKLSHKGEQKTTVHVNNNDHPIFTN